MSRFRILVVSAGRTLASWLTERLDRTRYSVIAVRTGPELIQAARRAQAHVAVLDGIDARPDAAQLEVALLKDACPGIQIVALSDTSTDIDGAVIEQGLFCYLADSSFGQLLRVIEAAAQERRPAADPIAVPPNQLRSVT